MSLPDKPIASPTPAQCEAISKFTGPWKIDWRAADKFMQDLWKPKPAA